MFTPEIVIPATIINIVAFIGLMIIRKDWYENLRRDSIFYDLVLPAVLWILFYLTILPALIFAICLIAILVGSGGRNSQY